MVVVHQKEEEFKLISGKNYGKIKKMIKNRNKNLVIGFGITTKNISSFKSSDGCVVGSEICKKISKF